MRFVRVAAVLVMGAGLAACGSGSGGLSIGERFLLGGSPPPPPAAAEPLPEIECPPVGVVVGGAAIRAQGGSNLRHQLSIGQVARECAAQADGSIRVKVGFEVRALLGPAGAPGRIDAPAVAQIKRGREVLNQRSTRVQVVVPAGDTQGSTPIVIDDLIVPPGTGLFEIEIGLGGSGAAARAPRERRG